MAESAVNLLIEYLGPLLVEEVKLLKGVRGEACKIRDELESMRAFLRDADAREENNDESIKEWVRQVRRASHDIEDILDDFILCTRQYHQDHLGIFGILHKMAHSIKQLKARRRIGKQIQDMGSQLSDISRRKDQYNLNRAEQVSNASYSKDAVYDPRVAALFTDESQLVGIDGPKTQLICWLVREEQRLSTVAVVGPGGLGKTTLVRKVYESEELKKHFEAFAWITVSQTFKKDDLLQKMIAEFNVQQAPSRVDSESEVELIQQLRGYLENKRFVLVLDDVWETDAWKLLSLALPIGENRCRVVLTTRRRDVASSCCLGPCDYIYEHQPLNPNMSWSLFCRRAFTANEENNCPPNLKMLAQSFVKKCGGLPLAIVTLGGLLASKEQTYVAWERMHHSLGSELESDSLGSMMKILWLSFNDLPYYLKSCYLYFSIFPEDYNIAYSQIINLWRAEGLITRKEGMTLEAVAESYIDALISRSLVEVTDKKGFGLYLRFRIHDLLREIIISKSREENQFVSSTDDNAILSDRIRRLSIRNKGSIVPKFECSSRLRSLFIFGMKGQLPATSITKVARLHLLRVVKITNVSLERFPQEVTSLLLLRYLSLNNTNTKHVPSSIGKLITLETLIIENNFICELPIEICKLQRLRHLSVRNTKVQFSHVAYGAKVPNGVGGLKSLLELRRVQAESSIVGELGKLTQLKSLEINKLKREDGPNFCTSIEKMRHLRNLEVSAIRLDDEIDLHSLSNPPPTLQELFLNGRLNMLPFWIATLQNLHLLSLWSSRLKDDPFKALGSLCNLVHLMIGYAYDGEVICVKEGQYPKLSKLWLNNLRELKKIMVEKGAMPNLRILLMERCKALIDVPSWLGHLTNLKQLSLTDMPSAFTESLQSHEGAERADFIRHIPLIDCYDSETKKKWKL